MKTCYLVGRARNDRLGPRPARPASAATGVKSVSAKKIGTKNFIPVAHLCTNLPLGGRLGPVALKTLRVTTPDEFDAALNSQGSPRSLGHSSRSRCRRGFPSNVGQCHRLFDWA